MGVLEAVVERLDLLDDHLRAIEQELVSLRTDFDRGISLTQEWYSRKEACEVKGVSLEFCAHHPHHFPAFGHRERISRGRYGFRREDVRVWLPKTFDEIEEEWKQLREENGSAPERERLIDFDYGIRRESI